MKSAIDYPTAEALMDAKGGELRAYLARYSRFYADRFGSVAKITPAQDLMGYWHFATVTFEDGTYRTFTLNFNGEWFSDNFRGRNYSGGPSYKYTLAEVLKVLEDRTLPLTNTAIGDIEDRLRAHACAKYDAKQKKR